MPDYRLTWEVDVSADSPKEAAEIALKMQRNPDSIATVFSVCDQDGEVTQVDLLEDDEEES